jgi:sulfur carrier protein ThiS
MVVQVRAAGHLFYRMPGQQSEMQVNIAPGEAVADLLTQLGLTRKQVWIIRINGQNVDVEHPLADGDSVELFPLVGGG